jgi:hypothetical protein
VNYIEDNDPQFELVRDVDHCRDCGHFHDPAAECPASDEACDDYRCCH